MPPEKVKQRKDKRLKPRRHKRELYGLITSPDLFPCRHGSSSKDEDYGNNVEGSPHKERQHPSTAPHGSEPG